MNRRNILIGGAILVVMVLAAGIFLYNYVFGASKPASGELTPIPVALGTSAPTLPGEMAEPTEMVEPTTEVDAYPAPAQVAAPTQPNPYPASGDSGSASVGGSGLTTYQINPDESKVSFTIFEELRGQPNNVVGTTNQVAGEVAVNLGDLSSAKIGVIKIDARGFATDDDRRNNMIHNRILHTDQYEFVTFTPTAISGLSGSAAPGQQFSFQVAGNLTIQDVTKPVVFDVSGQVESPQRLSGTATTTIQLSDFNIEIPSVPFVANVGQDVKLQIGMVLVPVS
jgi:polyisoprenoid-binding protein YceI